MSRNVAVVITDDLDGSADAEPVSFGFDGVIYEIDLNSENKARLEKVFTPFIEAGRRVRGAARGGRPGRSASSAADRAAVRAWAKEKGLAVSDRGRISADILRQYDESH